MKRSYRKNCPAMIAPLHRHRDGSPRKKPVGPYLSGVTWGEVGRVLDPNR